MKILMLSSDPLILEKDSFSRKRMEKYAELVDKLVIILLTRNRIMNYELGIMDKITIIPISGYFFRFFKAIFTGRRILKEEKIDLITCQDIEHCLVAYLLGKPFEAQIHTDIGSPYFWKLSWKNKLRYIFAKFLLPKASCIRVVSERIKKFLINEFKIPQEKISVISIFPQLDHSSSQPKKFPEFKKTILIVSRLTKEKNISLAIKAFTEVLKTHPDIGLVIVGDGPKKEKPELKTKNYKLQTKVRFEGYQKNLAQYYKGADIFLLTSWYEGFGLSVVEAMYFGLPVVMTDVGVAGELVINNETGLVVGPGDKKGLVLAIKRALEDGELRENLVKNSKTIINQFLENHKNYYQEIVNNWQKCAH